MRRRWRVGRLVAWAGWLGMTATALRFGATAFDTNPEHLIGLIGLAYLAAWGPFFIFSTHGAAGTLGRFALCTATVVMISAALEIPARLGAVDYRQVFASPTPPWQRSGNRPDPHLIYARLPHQKTRFRYDGAELYGLRGASPWRRYNCELVTDGHGFRNPDDVEHADVVVIGDSFIEGLHVEAGDLATAHLAGTLGRTVVNLGRTGYGPQQEYQVLRLHGVPLKPRVCVWAFYEGNDLQDLHEYDANIKNLKYVLDDRRATSPYARGFTRNALGFLIRTGIRPDPTRPALAHTGWFTDDQDREIPMYFGTGIQHGAEGPAFPRGESDEMKRVGTILRDARDLCRANDIALIVTFIPSKFRIYRDLCRFQDASPCRDWPTDDLPADVRRLVEGIGSDLGFVDLTPSLRAQAEQGRLVYLPDDTHWSEDGHRVAAEALAPAVAERLDRQDSATASIGR